jgi:hypothetical protein
LGVCLCVQSAFSADHVCVYVCACMLGQFVLVVGWVGWSLMLQSLGCSQQLARGADSRMAQQQEAVSGPSAGSAGSMHCVHSSSGSLAVEEEEMSSAPFVHAQKHSIYMQHARYRPVAAGPCGRSNISNYLTLGDAAQSSTQCDSAASSVLWCVCVCWLQCCLMFVCVVSVPAFQGGWRRQGSEFVAPRKRAEEWYYRHIIYGCILSTAYLVCRVDVHEGRQGSGTTVLLTVSSCGRLTLTTHRSYPHSAIT